MKAEFRSDELVNMPELFVVAENEMEWRALQLYLKLMRYGSVSVTAAYDKKDEE